MTPKVKLSDKADRPSMSAHRKRNEQKKLILPFQFVLKSNGKLVAYTMEDDTYTQTARTLFVAKYDAIKIPKHG